MNIRNIIFVVSCLVTVGAASYLFLGTQEKDKQKAAKVDLQSAKQGAVPEKKDNLAGVATDGLNPSSSGKSLKTDVATTDKSSATSQDSQHSLRGSAWSPEDVSKTLKESQSPVAPTLSKFFEVKRKFRRTFEEKAELQALLSDSFHVQTMSEFLVEKNRKVYSAEDEALRLTAVSFLNQAIDYEANPIREKVVEAAKAVILAENIKPEFPRKLKVSLAGDKVELALRVIVYFPTARTQLVAASSGTNQEIILRAANYVGDE